VPTAAIASGPAIKATTATETRRPHERTPPAGGAAVALPSLCADLLARESLGAALTPDELSTYARACKRQ